MTLTSGSTSPERSVSHPTLSITKEKMKISEFRQRYIEAMKMSERSKIAELFRLADDLESVEKTEENYRILSDVFSYLGYYTKAYHYLSEVANPQDMKDAKKL